MLSGRSHAWLSRLLSRSWPTVAMVASCWLGCGAGAQGTTAASASARRADGDEHTVDGAASSGRNARAPAVLRFAWQPGQRADVVVRQKGRQDGQSWQLRGSYQLLVESSRTGLLLRQQGFSGWKGKLSKQAFGGPAWVVVRVPTIGVGIDGRFQHVGGFDRIAEAVRADAAAAGVDVAAVRSVLDSLTSPEGVEAVWLDHWSTMVGMWAARRVDAGEHFVARDEAPVPQLGGGAIGLEARFEHRGSVACHERDKERRCALLAVRSTPDPVSLARVIGRLVPGGKVQNVSHVSSARVVVHPESLLPVSVTYTKQHSVTLQTGGETAERSRWLQTSYAFSWASVAASSTSSLRDEGRNAPPLPVGPSPPGPHPTRGELRSPRLPPFENLPQTFGFVRGAIPTAGR